MTKCTMKKDYLIYQEGDKPKYLFFIMEGEVLISKK